MYKTCGSQEKQDEGLAAITDLELDGIQAALLERAKHAALATAVALLEQDAEEWGGRRYECKTTCQGIEAAMSKRPW